MLNIPYSNSKPYTLSIRLLSISLSNGELTFGSIVSITSAFTSEYLFNLLAHLMVSLMEKTKSTGSSDC